jgi:hypothetical protein
MKYLIQTTEIYRVDTDAEAASLIAEAKTAAEYILAKYSSEKKEVKSKGEVIEEYFKVSLTKIFTDIKDPIGGISVIYEVDE